MGSNACPTHHGPGAAPTPGCHNLGGSALLTNISPNPLGPSEEFNTERPGDVSLQNTFFFHFVMNQIYQRFAASNKVRVQLHLLIKSKNKNSGTRGLSLLLTWVMLLEYSCTKPLLSLHTLPVCCKKQVSNLTYAPLKKIHIFWCVYEWMNWQWDYLK